MHLYLYITEIDTLLKSTTLNTWMFQINRIIKKQYFFLWLNNISLNECIPFNSGWLLKLFWSFGYDEWCCYEHLYMNFCVNLFSFLLCIYLGVEFFFLIKWWSYPFNLEELLDYFTNCIILYSYQLYECYNFWYF